MGEARPLDATASGAASGDGRPEPGVSGRLGGQRCEIARPHRGQCSRVQQSSCWPHAQVVAVALLTSRDVPVANSSLVAVVTTEPLLHES